MSALISRALRGLLGVAALIALGCTATGVANARTFHTVLQDDDLSLFSTAGLAGYMAQLRALGVDQLRISAEWKLEVPDPDSRRRPANVDQTDPGWYTGAGMSALDSAVRAASNAGLSVILDPAFSGPLWATTDPPPASDNGGVLFNTNIDVRAAAAWEQMLARRYSGRYVPRDSSAPLPQVQTFTLWNEPNDHTFLTPQWRAGVAVSADWYRRLVELAYPAIKRALPSAVVLIGNTAESGAASADPSRGVAPLAFIRRLACVDAGLRPVHDGSCASFRTVPADGYAQHPYERTAPPWSPSGRGQTDWAQMGDLPRLQALLDKLVAMRRLAPGAAQLWLTEQGYESNAELADRPWSEAQQAQLNADAEYLAWRDPQVVSFSQFLLRDTRTAETVAVRSHNHDPRANLAGTWTTGLERESGQPKPALSMFRSPVVARAVPLAATPFASGLAGLASGSATRVLEVWGRARPVSHPSDVEVQVALTAQEPFITAAKATSDANGIFDVSLALPPNPAAAVRFRWRTGDGSWQLSPATVASTFPAP